MRRISATVAMAVVWLVVLATPAGAHAADGEDATNFQTRLKGVTPEVPGLDVEVIENGNRMQVTNTTGEVVVIAGYQGEPYLRIGPDGVEENRRSPAVYLNQDRQGTTAVPGNADPEAEPDWSRVSADNTVRWHDHRIHWMSTEDPPAVREDPGRRHTVNPGWIVDMQVGDTPVQVTGDLVWVPGPSTAPWWALAVGLLAATAAAALSRAWRPALAVAVAGLVIADVVHAVGVARAGVGGLGSELGQLLTGSPLSLAGWLAGGAAVVLLTRGREAATYDRGTFAAGLAGLLIGVSGGLSDIGDIGRSQILFAGPDDLFRLTTALTLGLGLGVATGAAARILRHELRPPARTAPAVEGTRTGTGAASTTGARGSDAGR